MEILGVRIDNFSKKEILEKIGFFLNEEKFHQIATVNPEFILRAQKDREFKNILNKCDLNVADGIGLKYAFIRHFGWLKSRIAGVDLMDEVLMIANKKSLSIFLAVNKNGLSDYEEILTVLVEKYPNITFDGIDIDPTDCSMFHVPPRVDERPFPRVEAGPCSMILLCNFGAPAQEKFINLIKNDTIRLAMGVGGSFDFVTGRILRAPKLMQFFGLEWLFRFIQEPKYRFKRVLNAVVIFPFRILINR